MILRTLFDSHRGGRWARTLALAWLAAAATAAAAAPPGTPTIDRDRADRVAPVIPDAPPPRTGKGAAEVAARPAAEVTLRGFRYEGSSLPAAVLDDALRPFLGRPLTAETLQAVARSAAAAHAAGGIAYYAVSIPAQVPSGGVLTLRVVEGRLADYRLTNITRSTPTRLIAADMEQLMRERPLRRSSLERKLALLRDVPGQSLDAQVRQLDPAGALALDLTSRRKQLEVGVTLDNNGISNVASGVQAQLAVTVNGLLREADTTRLSAYLPFHPDRYQFYSASHGTAIGSDGLRLTGSLAHLRTRTRDSNLRGRARLAGVTASYPLVRSARSNLSLSLSLDGVDSSNYFLDVRFGDYRSRALRLAASWSRVDEKTGYAASAVFSRGLDVLGARPFAGFSEVRFGKLDVQAVAARSVSAKLVAKLAVKAQYSSSRLPVTERFSLGGSGAGLAFRAGDVTADKGIAGSLELSRQLPAQGKVPRLVLFAYADGGLGHVAARPDFRLPPRDYALASAGGGLRLAAGGWHASAQLAVPLRRPRRDRGAAPRLLLAIGRTF